MTRRLDLNLDAHYPHPVETVWHALTDPRALSQWLAPCDFRAVVGHRFTLRGTATENWRGYTHCCVTVLDPPHFMEWHWESADIPEPTRVTFRLRPVPGGTLLKLRHHGMTQASDIASLSEGWPEKLRQLETVLTI